MDEIAEDYGHGYRGVEQRIEALRSRAEAAEARVAELEFVLKMWRDGRLFHEPPFVVDEDVRWKAALKYGWKGFPTADEAIKALREEENS